MFRGVRDGATVVLYQSRSQVVREPDVVAVWMVHRTQNVDVTKLHGQVLSFQRSPFPASSRSRAILLLAGVLAEP